VGREGEKDTHLAVAKKVVRKAMKEKELTAFPWRTLVAVNSLKVKENKGDRPKSVCAVKVLTFGSLRKAGRACKRENSE